MFLPSSSTRAHFAAMLEATKKLYTIGISSRPPSEALRKVCVIPNRESRTSFSRRLRNLKWCRRKRSVFPELFRLTKKPSFPKTTELDKGRTILPQPRIDRGIQIWKFRRRRKSRGGRIVPRLELRIRRRARKNLVRFSRKRKTFSGNETIVSFLVEKSVATWICHHWFNTRFIRNLLPRNVPGLLMYRRYAHSSVKLA